jgi:hypothetical protein
MFPQTLVIAQSMAVMMIYFILWTNLKSVAKKMSGSAHIIVFVLMIIFMYTTSNYSFQFLKIWGV